MDLDTDDDTLRSLADGNPMDYSQWPDLLSRLIPRLKKVVHNDFLPASHPSPLSMLPSSQSIASFPPQIHSQEEPSLITDTSSQNSTASSQSTNKENAPPIDIVSGTLPPQILSLLTSIIQTLETLFSQHPPHTIQRFAELILAPKQHYRTLPSYLHAMDRVVHVTSGAQTFPLPPAIPDPSSAVVLSNGTSSASPSAISWGNPTAASQPTLGSDESLGGALLTPIPWLKNCNSNNHGDLERQVRTESTETIEGPNGAGSIETVSVSVNGLSSATATTMSTYNNDNGAAGLRAEGGVTQGELLRQEQRAGVVPATQLAGLMAGTDGIGEDDEMPHARGPEEIGIKDMGPQTPGSGTERSGPGIGMQGINVEAAVGRRAKVPEEIVQQPRSPKREADEELGAEAKRLKEIDEGGKSGDIELVDASEKGGEKVGETLGSDAVNTCAA